MKLNKMKSTLLVGVIVGLFVVSGVAIRPQKVQSIEPFFTLTAKTNAGGFRPDYLNFLKQHTARIGVNIDVVAQDWPSFIYELVAFFNFDICYVGLSGGGADPDPTDVFDENGSLNLFGYDTSMDYNETLGTGLNEWYIDYGRTIMPPDSQERIEHYYEWEQYLMDEIVPVIPTFSPVNHGASWSNLNGYVYADGLAQSWGKMSWDGLHSGQQSDTEIVVRDAAWSDLNPLTSDDTSSSFISGMTLDPLIYFDEDLSVHPHIATDWEFISDTQVRFSIREGIKWQEDPEGLFSNEEVTAEDVYFTFFAWKTVSARTSGWQWIDDMEIIDDYTIDFYIDADPTTPEKEPLAPLLSYMGTNILPEHYLNQSQVFDEDLGLSVPDTDHDSWSTYSQHCFGTGILEFGSYQEGVETEMNFFDDCWMVDSAVDKTGMDFVERFGDVWELDTLRIRVIPDTQTSLLEFEAGKLDIVGVTGYPQKREAYAASDDFTTYTTTSFSWYFFGYNMRENRGTPLQDRDPCPEDPSMSIGVAVRKAIAYAVDRQEINDVLHQGEYQLVDVPMPLKQGVWCNPNIIRYNFDLEKARDLMAKAGFDLELQTASVSETGPGFGLWITIVSMFAVSTVTVILFKKRRK